jgi:hypothetical protein
MQGHGLTLVYPFLDTRKLPDEFGEICMGLQELHLNQIGHTGLLKLIDVPRIGNGIMPKPMGFLKLLVSVAERSITATRPTGTDMHEHDERPEMSVEGDP